MKWRVVLVYVLATVNSSEEFPAVLAKFVVLFLKLRLGLLLNYVCLYQRSITTFTVNLTRLITDYVSCSKSVLSARVRVFARLTVESLG